MYRRPALRSFFAVAALAALTTLGLSACADPTSTPSGGGGSAATGASPGASASGGSYATTTWGLSPVDSVAKLVPDEYKNKPIQNGQYNDYPPQEFLQGQTLVGIQRPISSSRSARSWG
jgi:polar amino acid transport system substrate-binding protein